MSKSKASTVSTVILVGPARAVRRFLGSRAGEAIVRRALYTFSERLVISKKVNWRRGRIRSLAIVLGTSRLVCPGLVAVFVRLSFVRVGRRFKRV